MTDNSTKTSAGRQPGRPPMQPGGEPRDRTLLRGSASEIDFIKQVAAKYKRTAKNQILVALEFYEEQSPESQGYRNAQPRGGAS